MTTNAHPQPFYPIPFHTMRPAGLIPAHLPTASTYDEAAEALPPELDEAIEYLSCGDYVRVERAVAPADAAPLYGWIRRVNADVQYALVEKEVSGMREWFSLDELYLVLSAAAAALETTGAAASA